MVDTRDYEYTIATGESWKTTIVEEEVEFETRSVKKKENNFVESQ